MLGTGRKSLDELRRAIILRQSRFHEEYFVEDFDMSMRVDGLRPYLPVELAVGLHLLAQMTPQTAECVIKILTPTSAIISRHFAFISRDRLPDISPFHCLTVAPPHGFSAPRSNCCNANPTYLPIYHVVHAKCSHAAPSQRTLSAQVKREMGHP